MPTLSWKPGAGRAKPAPKPAAKSIRGTISAPIPIPSPMDDDEFPIRNPGSAKAFTSPEDEFPIRKPGTGIASPLIPSTELESDGTPPEEPHKKLENPSPEHIEGHRISPVVEQEADFAPDARPEPPSNPPPDPPTAAVETDQRPASPRKSSPRRPSPPRMAPFRSRTSPSTARTTNPPLSIARYSVISDAPSGQTGYSKDAPQRKKSTLRTALGRLFGRSKKRNGGGSRDTSTASARESRFMGSSQHRSDPTALGRKNERSPKRSTSLPLTEYDRPLRSHSIGPDDIMAIESVRNSLQADPSGAGNQARRRAATTTSRLLFQSRMRNPEWGAGLSPRPASTHGRGSSRAAAREDSEDPNEIGRAITSDHDTTTTTTKRRSRSLNGLQDLARPETRRRSDEIRFWRESYLSPLSSNAPEDMDADETAVHDLSAPESPFVERPPRTPPQPFNFGPIPNTMTGMPMVGMKITQVVSVDTRINDLESRANRLETVVNQLCDAVPGFKPPPVITTRPPGEGSSILDDHATSAYTTAPPLIAPPIPLSPDPRSTPRYASSRRSIETSDSRSQVSFGEAPTFIEGSLHPPSSTAAYSQTLPATAHPLRPASNSTVRVAASLPTLGGGGGGEGSVQDPVASLISQLEAERAARQALEAQVKKLSERVNTLSSTMFAMVRRPSEAASTRSQERLLAGGRSGSPLLQPPPPGKSTVQLQPVPTSAVALKPPASSRFEPDEDDEDELMPPPTGGEKEVFMTPLEERSQPQHVFGAFGEELKADDDDGCDASENKRKKAARTLSLSQLTVAKEQRARG